MKRGERELRIIGGRLRGRKILFPDDPAIRPTPDRVRETLFNWLAPHIAGMAVLDLFAGSGALGIEAWSRGAAAVTFVDSSREAVLRLRETLSRFEVTGARVENGDGMAYIKSAAGPWQLILLDPPFASELLAPALAQIARRKLLATGGFCYAESARGAPFSLPSGWQVHRQGLAGEVGYHLLHEAQRDLSGHL
jgi:16S rRNA (guanine966-N2)-methyltransferase